MHIMPPCITCSEDVDFLCKCVNLLYLIKELILCDLTMHSWHVGIVFFNNSQMLLFPHMKQTQLFFPVHVYYASNQTSGNQKHSN